VDIVADLAVVAEDIVADLAVADTTMVRVAGDTLEKADRTTIRVDITGQVDTAEVAGDTLEKADRTAAIVMASIVGS
jgi:hypothetical protein